ncbi:hypothetical protein [Pendulispora albinea]|uniref:Uncharacterized protein n=1 Tax=Pendulispora albinea TaxID=2741071 RepID=A0ABZ2LWX8_9BACT
MSITQEIGRGEGDVIKLHGEYVAPERTVVDRDELRAAIVRAWRHCMHEDIPSCALAILVQTTCSKTCHWNWNLLEIRSTGHGPHTYRETLVPMVRGDAERAVAHSTPAEPCEFAAGFDEISSTLMVRYLPRHPLTRFRVYGSLDEAAIGLVSWLRGHHKDVITAVRRRDVEAFTVALGRAMST